MHPILFESGTFVLPSYLFVTTLISCIAVFWSVARAKKLQLNRNLALDLCMVVMIAGFIGGRLLHVFIEYPEVYAQDPIRVLRFWEGGFVFYGGFFFSLIAGLLLIYIRDRSSLGRWLDFAAPIAAFAYGTGRIGCFLAGCCYGRECLLPWGVMFPAGAEAPTDTLLHPTQLYAFLGEYLILLFLFLIESKESLNRALISKSGDLFFLWAMLHGLNRLIMEYFRADFRGPDIGGLSVSSILSATLVALASYLFLRTGTLKTATQKVDGHL